jgi:CheY-like chemotaxis protein
VARILWIDEDIGLLQSHYDHLKIIGHHDLVIATDPEKAIEEIDRWGDSIDVIILDIMLPVGEMFSIEEANLGLTTGVILLEQIKSKLPDVPIVVLTAVANEAVKQLILASGIPEEYYFDKPIGPRNLLAKVQEVLKGTKK